MKDRESVPAAHQPADHPAAVYVVQAQQHHHKNLFALTANKNTKLESLAKQTFILSCGKEQAVAATKSVAEQTLFYQSLLSAIAGKSLAKKLPQLADAFGATLTMPIDEKITNAIASFSGRFKR